MGIGNTDMANLFQNEATSLLKMTLLTEQSGVRSIAAAAQAVGALPGPIVVIELSELASRIDHILGGGKTSLGGPVVDPNKLVRACDVTTDRVRGSPLVDGLTPIQLNWLVMEAENCLRERRKAEKQQNGAAGVPPPSPRSPRGRQAAEAAGSMSPQQLFELLEQPKLVLSPAGSQIKVLSPEEKVAVQNFLGVPSMESPSPQFALLFGFAVELSNFSLKVLSGKDPSFLKYQITIRFAGYACALAPVELPKSSGFFKKAELPKTWYQRAEFILDGPSYAVTK